MAKKQRIVPLIAASIGPSWIEPQVDLVQWEFELKEWNDVVEEVPLRRSQRTRCQAITEDYVVYLQEHEFAFTSHEFF